MSEANKRARIEYLQSLAAQYRIALEAVMKECGAVHFQRSNVYRIASSVLSSQERQSNG